MDLSYPPHYVKDNCASCNDFLEGDRDKRYVMRGNFCEKCCVKAYRRYLKRASKVDENRVDAHYADVLETFFRRV